MLGTAQVEKVRQVAYDIAAAANGELKDIRALLKVIHKQLDQVIDARSFYISLWDKPNEMLTFPYVVDEKQPEKKTYESRKLSKGLTELVINTGRSLLVSTKQIKELAEKKKIRIIGPLPKIWLGIPLRNNSDGETIGVLAVQSYTDENAYSNETLELLEFVSGQISNSIGRLQVQESLKRSEKYFRSLTENSSDVITILNDKGEVTYESPSQHRVLGYKGGQNKNLFKLVHTSDMFKVARTYLQVLNDPSSTKTIEFRFQHKKGQWLHFESVFSNFLKDPEVAGVVINSRDITDRKTAENKLRLSSDILNPSATLLT